MSLALDIAGFALVGLALLFFVRGRSAAGWTALLATNGLFVTVDILNGGTGSLVAAGFNSLAAVVCVLYLADFRRSRA